MEAPTTPSTNDSRFGSDCALAVCHASAHRTAAIPPFMGGQVYLPFSECRYQRAARRGRQLVAGRQALAARHRTDQLLDQRLDQPVVIDVQRLVDLVAARSRQVERLLLD